MITAGHSAARRLLVITYHFPPDGTIGGQRWAGLSKYLVRLGWEVHIVTASPAGRNEEVPGLHRHVCARRRTLNDIYRARIARSRKAAPPPASVGDDSGYRRKSRAAEVLSTIRRALGSSLSLPDHGRGWVLRATAEARRLLKDHEFDCVISSGPPHSAHLAGLLATFDRQTDFWIDMRDPWSITHEMNTPEDGFIRAERRLLARFEGLIFPRAAKVFANTREFAAALRASQPNLKVAHFPNGIDLEQLPARDPSAVDHGSIAYIGTLYAGRTLTSVFAAMRSILEVQPATAGALRLTVAGPLESPHRERMHADIEAAGLTSVVNVLGVIPRDRALQLLSRAHLALVLAQDQPLCVPAKLYECVGLGVPTLVIAEPQSAAACEARRIGAMTADPDDVGALSSLFSDMLAGRVPKKIDPALPISYEELAAEMDRLLGQRVPRLRPQTDAIRKALPLQL